MATLALAVAGAGSAGGAAAWIVGKLVQPSGEESEARAEAPDGDDDGDDGQCQLPGRHRNRLRPPPAAA
jgi:hypothetical protein